MKIEPQTRDVGNKEVVRRPTQDEDPAQMRRRTVHRWFYVSLVNPFTIFPLVVFFVAWGRSVAPDSVVFLVESLGLREFVRYRTSGSDFEVAAAAYWIAALLCIVPGACFSWWLARRYSLASIVRERLVNAEYPSARKFGEYSLVGGYLRWAGGALLAIAALLSAVLLNAEPTACDGCERRSAVGFLLVNWLGLHAVLCLLYAIIIFLGIWRDVHFDLMERKNG